MAAAVARLTRRLLSTVASNAAPLPHQAARGSPLDYVVAQATPQTHGFLFTDAAREITPGITAAEYARRRRGLMALLPPGSVAVLPSAEPLYMEGIIPTGIFRQDPTFFYLTGFCAPGATAVLESSPASSPADPPRFTLLVRPRHPSAERWDGPRADVAACREFFGADDAAAGDAAANARVAAALRRSAAATGGRPRLVWDAGGRWHPAAAARLPALAECIASTAPVPLSPAAHALRWRKSEAEVSRLRASSCLAASGIVTCVSLTDTKLKGGGEVWRGGGHPLTERAVAACFEHVCRSAGADRMAYPPVAAAGDAATFIHYGAADAAAIRGDLFLLDAGCELHGYCSDVTRTWPLGGRFSPSQRAVYDVVLAAHGACVDAVVPGATLAGIHALCCRVLGQGLCDLGMPGARVIDYCPHLVGHWLGLSTHDTPSVGHDTPLQPGVVLTIEPGLYFGREDLAVPPHLRGIGIRIEDDVVVTAEGREVLSRDAPIDPGAIEELAGGAADRGHVWR